MSPSSNGPAPANVRRPGSPDSELSIVQPESANAEPADSTVRIPITSTLPPGSVQVDPRNGRVSIVVPDAPLNEVLSALARNQGLNIISAEDITARVSITLHDIPFEQALTQILSAAGCTWTRQDNVLIVTTLSADRKLTPQAQGRQLRVFPLDYVSAVDVDLVVKGLVSAAGQSFATSSTDTDNRKTQETIVVEDLPEYLARIEQYIQQIDQPPRQVLIEVHILSVELQDDAKHGVNFEYLKKLGTPEVTLKTAGFADAGASPAFLFNIAAGELNLLLEALETTNDAKTLATPKVLALNGQEARIQIGEQLGFRVTTTTQTSTMESVEFLDVGVVLRVTPRITRDNHVVMTVKPEVSSGENNQHTELPAQDTTDDDTPEIIGTAEADATVEVFVGTTSVGTTTADGSGNWSITSSLLIGDDYTVTATATEHRLNEFGEMPGPTGRKQTARMIMVVERRSGGQLFTLWRRTDP